MNILYVAARHLASTSGEVEALSALQDIPGAKVTFPQGLFSPIECVRTVDEVAAYVEPDDYSTVEFAQPFVAAAARLKKTAYIVTIDATGKALVAPWSTPVDPKVVATKAPATAPVQETAQEKPAKGKKSAQVDPALTAELEAALKGK